MNNYEKIKNMSVDEMASFLKDHADCFDCPACYVTENFDCAENYGINCLIAFNRWLLKDCEE